MLLICHYILLLCFLHSFCDSPTDSNYTAIFLKIIVSMLSGDMLQLTVCEGGYVVDISYKSNYNNNEFSLDRYGQSRCSP